MGHSNHPHRIKDRIASAVPMLRWLPEYDPRRLRGDLLAGAIIAALMVPQSLGYARIAGVPVEVGLYAVPLALLAYAALGSSPQLIVGPASTVAIVSGSLVADIARDNPEDAVAITSALAIAAGIVLIATGLLRIAWVAEFLSKPIVTGFVFGLTLTIVIGELPTLLGIPKPPGDLIGVLIRTLQNLDDTHLPTAIVGGSALVLLFGGRRITQRIPWGLVTLVGGVVASNLLDLESEGVATIGDVPSGLPPLGLPLIPRDDLGAVVVGGISLALVALAEGLAATRLFATRGGYRVETEHELVGMGAANIGAGLSGGLGVAGSLSKTASAEQAGSTSQVSGLTAAGLVVIVLLTLTWFFTELPQTVLSAIVVVAVWGLMDVAALRRYLAVRRADAVAATVGIAGVVLFGPLPGLGIAIATSLLAIIYRSSSPRMEVLGKITDEKAAWGRMRGHTTRKTVPGIVVIRLDAPLFWANAMAIEDRLLEEVDQRPDTRALVLDLEATSQLGTTSADMLQHVHDELAARGIRLYLARVIHPVSAVLERSGFLATLGDEHIWHSISQCVRAARRATGLKGGGDTIVRDADDDEMADGEASQRTDAPLPDEEEEEFETEVLDDEAPTEADLYAGRRRVGEKRDNATSFYLMAIRDGRPRDAVDAYVGDRFEQHRPGISHGAEGVVEFCERFADENPSRYVRVVRS
ncbi:MAG: sulfate permease, partial [Ilumatobacter sp.]|uniref:sulfate permease n=1 Tax=Ilumatobacter sp. TaxID=1967498 RepID=UPI0026249FE2